MHSGTRQAVQWSKLWHDNLAALGLWPVWKYMAIQDIRKRFHKSVFGPMWIILHLAILTGGLGFIYGRLFNQPLHDFLLFFVTGLVIWNYLVGALVEGSVAFVGSQGYIKQLCCPKQVYLWRTWFTQLVVFAVGFAACIVVAVFYNRLGWAGLFYGTIGLICLSVVQYFHIMLAGYLGARFFDIPHALRSLLPMLLLATPVTFSRETLKAHNLDFVYRLNPFCHLMDIVRVPFLYSKPASPDTYGFCFIYAVLLCGFAVWAARRLDNRIVYLI